MKEILNYRYYILAGLVGAGLACMLADTDDADILKWLSYQFAFKVVGIASLFMAYKLINRWNPQGKIDALAKLSEATEKILSK